MKKLITAIIFVGLLSGCGKWPDIVENEKHIKQLDPNLTSLRSRGLADKDIPALSRLKKLEKLYFRMGVAAKDSNITDEGLEELSKLDLPSLKLLDLGYCDKITDAGLVYVAKMNTVKELGLSVCDGLTDEGLKNLAGMTQLERLDLRGNSGITDDGLLHLKGLKNLADLPLGGCERITEEGVAELKKVLPKCNVAKDEREWAHHAETLKGYRDRQKKAAPEPEP